MCDIFRVTKKLEHKHIGLFGGSFNPPHLGHAAVLADLIKQKLFDEIWILPVATHAFNKELLPFAARLKLVELLVAAVGSPLIKISTIENELGKSPNYTFDTVTELKRRHPDCEFTMIVGSDVKNSLPKWHRIEELKSILKFHFIPRAGFENSPYPQVTSTEVRDKIKHSESIAELTPPNIAAYLKAHAWYK